MKFQSTLAVAALGALTVTASAQQTPSVVWEERNATQVNILRAIAWSPDGATLATGAGDVNLAMGNRGELTFWNAMTGQLINRVTQFDSFSIRRLNDLVYHPSGDWVATAEGQGPQSSWAINGASSRFAAPGGEHQMSYPVQSSAMEGIEISPDGTLLARAQWDNPEVWVVNADTGQIVHRWTAHSGGVTAVKFSPDGQYLATGGKADNTVRIWRLSDRSLVQQFEPTGQTAWGALSIAFSPDGQLITAANRGYGQRFRLWRISDGELLFAADPVEYLAHARVRFTSDGKHLVMSERSSQPSQPWVGRIRFLNVPSLELKADWHFTQGSPNNGVTGFDLSPNGDYIAFTQWDGILSMALNPVGGRDRPRNIPGRDRDR
jgi:WD40 repeat protein